MMYWNDLVLHYYISREQLSVKWARLPTPIATDLLEFHPVITQKTMKVQDRLVRVLPDQWPQSRLTCM